MRKPPFMGRVNWYGRHAFLFYFAEPGDIRHKLSQFYKKMKRFFVLTVVAVFIGLFGVDSFAMSGGNVETFTVNGVSFEMVRVDGGTYQMGSNSGYDWEKPVHAETVGTFYIGKTEVTQRLWSAVMGNNPSNFRGENLPVENAHAFYA